MSKSSYDLLWHRPSPSPARGSTTLKQAAPQRGRGGIPPPPDLAWVEVQGVETPRDELLALLTLAAEVEHAFLVQYLYATASLDVQGSTVTQQLREMIRTVALQEMAHLISVQNLLLAVGGPDHLHVGRDTLRAKTKDNPMPFALEPVPDLTLS